MRILIALLLAIGTTSLYANNSEQCSRDAKAAEVIMKGRQTGMSLQDALDINAKHLSDAQKDRYDNFVLEAYGQPGYQTPSMQQRAIRDFADRIHLSCLRGTIK